jgi:hypothetical protein
VSGRREIDTIFARVLRISISASRAESSAKKIDLMFQLIGPEGSISTRPSRCCKALPPAITCRSGLAPAGGRAASKRRGR